MPDRTLIKLYSKHGKNDAPDYFNKTMDIVQVTLVISKYHSWNVLKLDRRTDKCF